MARKQSLLRKVSNRKKVGLFVEFHENFCNIEVVLYYKKYENFLNENLGIINLNDIFFENYSHFNKCDRRELIKSTKNKIGQKVQEIVKKARNSSNAIAYELQELQDIQNVYILEEDLQILESVIAVFYTFKKLIKNSTKK